jgi:phage baseplate assembly protein W
MNLNTSTYYRDWAYDINKNPITQGELWDKDAIDQSIEMILGTIWGERLFNPSFGSGLQLKIFQTMTPSMAEETINEIIASIKKWEDRITIIEDQVQLIINMDSNSIVLILPYVVNSNNVQNTFKKKIIM